MQRLSLLLQHVGDETENIVEWMGEIIWDKPGWIGLRWWYEEKGLPHEFYWPMSNIKRIEISELELDGLIPQLSDNGFKQ